MKILKYPHPALRVQARVVATIDKGVQAAAAGMLDLMYKHEGLGLAAPQVGLDILRWIREKEIKPFGLTLVTRLRRHMPWLGERSLSPGL